MVVLNSCCVEEKQSIPYITTYFFSIVHNKRFAIYLWMVSRKKWIGCAQLLRPCRCH